MSLRNSYIDDDSNNSLFRVQRGAFLDPELFAAERARIFDRSWIYLGHESEVMASGDFRMRELGARRIVFVRGKDRVVRALLNSCTHRGAEVCREKSGNATRTATDIGDTTVPGGRHELDESGQKRPVNRAFGDRADLQSDKTNVLGRRRVVHRSCPVDVARTTHELRH